MTQANENWPALVVEDWQDTRDTVHLWTQIVGKVKLAATPLVNHWWNIALYVDARGLTTSLMSWESRAFDVSFDFVEHVLNIRMTDGSSRSMALEPRSVADFHAEFRRHLDDLGISVLISPVPVEIADVIPFADDTTHASYDAAAMNAFWRSLVSADRVMTEFRADFSGKSSPVHFFWGAFDLAVTRFSGRVAPPHPGGVPNCPDWVMTEAYSAEVSSAGYWPGGAEEGAFYSYAYPAPTGFESVDLGVDGAYFDSGLGEFVLPYRTVRTAAEPERLLRSFLDSTAAAAKDLAAWPE
ncbi:DUF5996 family protein [Mycobacterium sp. 236(2023)]|uniref:DUF5996 family protein n=1 Tax=Mycobacterium sp. 236(2023) TaxID=3038163 RepID=UPI0024154AB7|nr:DUF5996 family protein [Mycobacterium sp. 236(2023)]MDG4665628.1 DUF5996 family protein [Mycobacterium sp. 236(2023)]